MRPHVAMRQTWSRSAISRRDAQELGSPQSQWWRKRIEKSLSLMKNLVGGRKLRNQGLARNRLWREFTVAADSRSGGAQTGGRQMTHYDAFGGPGVWGRAGSEGSRASPSGQFPRGSSVPRRRTPPICWAFLALFNSLLVFHHRGRHALAARRPHGVDTSLSHPHLCEVRPFGHRPPRRRRRFAPSGPLYERV